MKQLKEFLLNESSEHFHLDEVVSTIFEVAYNKLGHRKFLKASAQELLDAACDGEMADFDGVAEMLLCDVDDLTEFIYDHYDEILKRLETDNRLILSK